MDHWGRNFNDLQAMKPQDRDGFTLIELLIVITIIAVLAGIAIPVITSVMNKARETQARTVIKDLAVAVSAYRVEYNRLPVEGMAGEDAALKTDGSDPLIYVLLGQRSGALNSRGEKFFNANVATNQRNGVVMSGASAALYDPWGRPYEIILDGDGDHLVHNPDMSNEDGRISESALPRLPAETAVFSSGRDGRPHTRDDIVSWR